MHILYYNDLKISSVKASFHKVVDMLKCDDFYSAEVKKLKNTGFYRAKLDYSNRLLFKLVRYQEKTYALLLEIIEHHAYEKSRFLRGAKIDEQQILESLPDSKALETEPIPYLNAASDTFYFLDKIISFDPEQTTFYHLPLPLIMIGTAGSGKTMLTLEKMKELPGKLLYITHSAYLVENARNLYYARHYANDGQEIDFLSYREFLETLRIPAGKEMTLTDFTHWLTGMPSPRIGQNSNKLYEEFKGVLTGTEVERPYLSRETYLNLGVKQSIYSAEDRPAVYDLFEKYRACLDKQDFYDSNLIAYNYLSLCQPQYDYLIVDEVQDFTLIQLCLIFKALSHPANFLLCGDSHQIVHPNFFSWAKIKTLFYQQDFGATAEITRILNKNYRNAPAVTQLANRLLALKNKRFGSIDRESTYLVESQAQHTGGIHYLRNSEKVRQTLNDNTRQSIKFAVIVIDDAAKSEARQYFATPLVFSVQEAKGLEYDNVILYNFVSSQARQFEEIAQGIQAHQLNQPLVYGRTKDKTDRSLEIYKFHINALYVAITRTIRNLYWVETLDRHSLLDLLGLNQLQEDIVLTAERSSLDDWQKEAKKLELQGKKEQADAIQKQLLQKKPVPWKIFTAQIIGELEKKIFSLKILDKTAQLQLLEYAVVYNLPAWIERLALRGFKPAQRPQQAWSMIERKYFLFYSSNNPAAVLRETEQYGVNFRTIFNMTPLMIASLMGNVPLATALLEKGANAELTDNLGRTAFQLALQKGFNDKKFATLKLGALHSLLSPGHLSVRADNRLIKLDAHTMEYFLLNLLLGFIHQHDFQHHLASWRTHTFCTQDFMDALATFPEDVLLERRKRRSYLSSILSKNEVNRADIYNRKLFVRFKTGYYRLNPDLAIKSGNDWIAIKDILGVKNEMEQPDLVEL